MKITVQVENQFALLAENMLEDLKKTHARQILLSIEFSTWLGRNALLQQFDGFWWFGGTPTYNMPFKPFTYVLLK